ncbi:MAG: DUF4835 family protein, partial [Chitinophagaceae bacterium]|nr:DUF4835 family protein [Chitinophagaceae bacterium]
MIKRLLISGCLALAAITPSVAQELQARISINSSAISSQVDKKIFQTLQTAIQNLLNNRKWTNDTYQQQEK